MFDYLTAAKGTIPYEMITRYDFLDISPEDGNFFLLHLFYFSLKDDEMTMEENRRVQKCLKNLSDHETKGFR